MPPHTPLTTEQVSTPFNREVLDYPTAWAIQKCGGLLHHERCSSVEGWHPLSGPGLLCDCGAVKREYERLNVLEGK